MIKKELSLIIDEAIKKVIRNCGVKDIKAPQYNVEVPPGNIGADYATNAAMVLAPVLKKSPFLIAEEITAEVSGNKEFFKAVEFVKPGFINFHINENVFYNEVARILKEGEDYGRQDMGKKKKVMIEFVSANPTGPFHVGHGRGAALGDSLANIMKALNYNVVKEYYVNDMGNQIDLLADSLLCVYDNKDVPPGGYEGNYLKEICKNNKDFIRDNRSNREVIRKFVVDEMLERYATKDLVDFGLFFDNWFYESSLYKENKAGKNEADVALDKLRANKHVYEMDGALWFRSTGFADDKDRVVIRKDGTRTYLASDIAYHHNKFERGFETVINIWGADHHGYIDRVKGAISGLGYDSEKLKILLYQLVNLTREGKPVVMSKRKADYVTLRQVIDEVGSDACRFFYLMRNANTPLDFDLELAKKQSQENPVYYVQYAYARICSIFREAKKMGIKFTLKGNLNLLKEPEELTIIKKLSSYPDLLLYCCKTLEPHHLTGYMQDLVGVFHSYYMKHRVLGDDRELTESRLMLASALQTVVRNSLKMLGISTPEEM